MTRWIILFNMFASKEHMRVWRTKRYNDRKAEIFNILGSKCARCGNTDIDCLEIDHRIAKDKSFEVLTACWWMSMERLIPEVNKCQLLCNKCHTDKSIVDHGHKAAIGTHGTLSSYRYCKCALCRKAKSEYSKVYKRRKGIIKGVLPRTGLVHGTSNAYAYYKCRCDVCKKSNTMRGRAYREKPLISSKN